MMKEKGLTEGAAKKLHKKLEELRFVSFFSKDKLLPTHHSTEFVII